jgi:hypothetical protein
VSKRVKATLVFLSETGATDASVLDGSAAP